MNRIQRKYKAGTLSSAVRFARFLVAKKRHLSAAKLLLRAGASTELVHRVVWLQS